MLLLELSQLLEQMVIFPVGDLRTRLDVILPIVMPDLPAQGLDLSGGRRGHGFLFRMWYSSSATAPTVATASTTS